MSLFNQYSFNLKCVSCLFSSAFGGSGEQASTSASVRPPSVTAEPQPTTPGERNRSHRSRSPRQTRAGTMRGSWSPSTDREERLLPVLRERHPIPETALNESYHFALSLVPLLSKLDHNKRQHAKIGMLNLLVDLDRPPVGEPAQPGR